VVKQCLVFVFLALLAGCATISPEEYLGTKSEESRGTFQQERLPQTVSMSFPGRVNDVDGYAIHLPPDRRESEIVCRTFADVTDKEVEICRKTSRVFVGGVEYSAFIHDGTWYVFVPKEREVSALQFPTPDGKEVFTMSGRETKKLNVEEVVRIYGLVMRELPYISKPIGGVSLLFGDEALTILTVPSLTTFEERWGYCGGLSFSSTEVVGIVAGSPLSMLPKIQAGICSLVTRPNFLTKVAKKPYSEGAAFIGDQ